jgi:hypothetical protein
MIDHIKPLTQQQRLDARQKAIQVIEAMAGVKPERDHFKNTTISKYPTWITDMVVTLSLVVLLTAFLLSAIRLYHIGYETFHQTLENEFASIVAGFAIVLLSEAASVLFTLALSVIGQSQTQRWILLASIIGTAALALSGNYYVALHQQDLTVFSVREAMLPPLLTLSTAYVLKELLLSVIELRHADQQAYEVAVEEWKQATAYPEDHPDFLQAYANELRDLIIKANRRRKTVKEAMGTVWGFAWRELIRRELKTENWFLIEEPERKEVIPEQSESPLALIKGS